MSGPGDEFVLPDVGEGLDQAEIVEWLVTEGDRVVRDQPLVEILTDKSQTQLPAPKGGVIKRLGFAEGDIAQVGQVLVEYESNGDGPAAEQSGVTQPAEGSSPDAGHKAPGAARAAAPAPTVSPTARRPKASPVVRRRAVDGGIDLSSIDGTGPGGRITIDDLEAALAAPATSPAIRSPHEPTPRPTNTAARDATASPLGQISPGRHALRGIRRVTAQAMNESWKIPHIHGADEFDATNLLNGRKRIKELQPDRAAALTPLAFFVMAVADGLRRFPLLNASISVGDGADQGHVDVHDDVNVGIAVSTEAGLLVPVIRHADQRSLFDLAAEIGRLSAAARDRSITADDLRHGTCTVSNYGSLGGRYAAPLIRPPEVVIVGFGAIRNRPIVVDGAVVARPTLPIAVAVDHRLIDGDLMTAFQEHIIGLLTDPVALLAR